MLSTNLCEKAEYFIEYIKSFSFHLWDFVIIWYHSYFDDLKLFILPLFLLFIFSGFLLHEIGHYRTIKRLAKNNPNFFKPHNTKIKRKSITKWYTKSDYLQFLEKHRHIEKYHKEIKKISFAGFKQNTLLYPSIMILSGILMYYSYPFFLLIIVSLVPPLFIETLSYFINSKEKYDDKGELISQPDRFLVKHPEQFKNIHK